MSENNRDWLHEQLQAARVKKFVGNSVIKLVDFFEEEVLSSAIKEEDQKKIIDIFSKVSLGHPIAVEQSKNEDWVDLKPGQITVGDIVRIKPDAFTGDLGKIHNNRRGRVVAVRYGDVIFNSEDGKNPPLNGSHYSPYVMEKLILKDAP